MRGEVSAVAEGAVAHEVSAMAEGASERPRLSQPIRSRGKQIVVFAKPACKIPNLVRGWLIKDNCRALLAWNPSDAGNGLSGFTVKINTDKPVVVHVPITDVLIAPIQPNVFKKLRKFKALNPGALNQRQYGLLGLWRL